MRRSHLEVPLAFPHESIYFEVIKSQVELKEVGDVYSHMVKGGNGRMCLEPSRNHLVFVFLRLENKLNGKTRGQCKVSLPCP